MYTERVKPYLKSEITSLIQEAVKKSGSCGALAGALSENMVDGVKIHRQSVHNWNRGLQIPSRRIVLLVASSYPLEDWRGDLFRKLISYYGVKSEAKNE